MDDFANISENDLLSLISKGDELAFKFLYDKFHQQVARFISTYAENQYQLEEIVQDVFVKIWLNKEKLTEVNNIKAYLFTISKNHALNLIKKRVNESVKFNIYTTQKLNENKIEDDNEISNNLYSVLDHAVNNLPPQQKKSFYIKKAKQLKIC